VVDTTIGSFTDYSSSYAGFCVAEVLDNIGDTVAVGRTTDVAGELALSGKTMTAATIEVQLATITSDRPRRDPAIQQSLDTNSFPTATLRVDRSERPANDSHRRRHLHVMAQGTLTIHGVSQPVEVVLQERLVGGVIVVVGSADLMFSDYGVTMPRAPIVLSVADRGSIEFHLFFSRA